MEIAKLFFGNQRYAERTIIELKGKSCYIRPSYNKFLIH